MIWTHQPSGGRPGLGVAVSARVQVVGINFVSSAVATLRELEVEVEHEAPFISCFPVATIKKEGDILNVYLGTKHTACLAEDKCGVNSPDPQAVSFKPLPKISKAGCCG